MPNPQRDVLWYNDTLARAHTTIEWRDGDEYLTGVGATPLTPLCADPGTARDGVTVCLSVRASHFENEQQVVSLKVK